ncbi:MAG: hypothetical protein AVDCRST_MAG78-1867, partial [uncultured Rubrobacteraceae bacterium]
DEGPVRREAAARSAEDAARYKSWGAGAAFQSFGGRVGAGGKSQDLRRTASRPDLPRTEHRVGRRPGKPSREGALPLFGGRHSSERGGPQPRAAPVLAHGERDDGAGPRKSRPRGALRDGSDRLRTHLARLGRPHQPQVWRAGRGPGTCCGCHRRRCRRHRLLPGKRARGGRTPRIGAEPGI